MNYTKEIKELANCRILGDNLNIELMNIDKQIHELRVKRAAKVLKLACVIVILGLGLLSLIF